MWTERPALSDLLFATQRPALFQAGAATEAEMNPEEKVKPKWVEGEDGAWYTVLTGGTLHLGKKFGEGRVVWTPGDWKHIPNDLEASE